MRSQGERECVNLGCGKAGLWVCSQCQVEWYCSAQCQTDHWPQHWRQCPPPPPPLQWPHITSILHTKQSVQTDSKSKEKSVQTENQGKQKSVQTENHSKQKSVQTENQSKQKSVQTESQSKKEKSVRAEASEIVVYPEAISSSWLKPQVIRRKLTELLLVESVISPAEFASN